MAVLPAIKSFLFAQSTQAAAAAAGLGTASTGTTAQRPTDAGVGHRHFDTTLGKPVYLKTAPSTWVDAAGLAA